MSNRVSYLLVVVFVLLAAALRVLSLATLPPGLHDGEITDVRIIETVRAGRVEVFYDLGGEGREGGYHAIVAAITSVTGAGLLGYRLPSVFAGLLTLALIYALGRRLYGALAGVAAAGLLALTFLAIGVSRGIGREAFVPLLVTAVLLALARALPIYGEVGRTGTRSVSFAALGILLGLGFYVHPIHLVLVVLSMILIGYLIFSRRSLTRRTLSYAYFAVVVMLILATPYLISTLQRPDLAGASRLIAPGTRPPLEAIINGLGGIFVVGDANVLNNVPGRPLLDLVSGLIIVIGIFAALRSARQARYAMPLLALLLIAPVALLSGSSPNFLAFAPLLPLLALFFGLGVRLIAYNVQPAVRRAVVVALIVLVAFNVVWTGRDLFSVWAASPAVGEAYHQRLGAIAHYLDRTADDTPTVMCAPELQPSGTAARLADTQVIALMTHRRFASIRYADCGISLILADGGERQQILFPEAGGLATTHPYLQEWLAQGRAVAVEGLPDDAVIELDVSAALADRIGAFTTTAPVAFAPETAGGMQVAAPPIRFGGNLTFLGYEPPEDRVYRPGDTVTVISYWRVDGVVPSDLRLFIHILSDPAAIAAQNDLIGVLAAPLRPRDVFVQVTFVQLPWAIPVGTYSISLGAYTRASATRLDVFDGETPRGTRLFVGDIMVE